MAWMVLAGKFVGNHTADHRRGPDTGKIAIGNRPAFDYIGKMQQILSGQFRGTATAMSFQERLKSVAFIVTQPFGHLRERCVKDSSDGTAGIILCIQKHGMEPFGNSKCTFVFGIPLQTCEF